MSAKKISWWQFILLVLKTILTSYLNIINTSINSILMRKQLGKLQGNFKKIYVKKCQDERLL